jgi:hypothetical protein
MVRSILKHCARYVAISLVRCNFSGLYDYVARGEKISDVFDVVILGSDRLRISLIGSQQHFTHFCFTSIEDSSEGRAHRSLRTALSPTLRIVYARFPLILPLKNRRLDSPFFSLAFLCILDYSLPIEYHLIQITCRKLHIEENSKRNIS